jgi:GPH family glycoside/pentoside/hexuronide:cation symporter
MAKPEQAANASRIPLLTKLAYGLPALAGAAMSIPIAVHMPRFYSDEILAPLGFIAVAVALARALDAITDPAMGWISDHTRTEWGRRMPWIALGTPFAAVAFWALFNPATGLDSAQASLWFGLSFGLFFLFQTMVTVPHSALGAELSLDYNERSSLFGYQSFFVLLGTVLGSVLPDFLQSDLEMSAREAYNVMGITYALLMVLLTTPLLVFVRERPEFKIRESNPLVPGVRRALRNRPFRILLIAAVISAIPAALPAIMTPYFTYYVIQPENPERWIMLYLLAYIGTGFLFLPAWVAAAKRIGKLPTYVICSLIGTTGAFILYWMGPGTTWRVFWMHAYVGIAFGGPMFLVPAMGADVIDYDELRTGKRREGQFGAFWAAVPKLVAIPSVSIPLAILSAVGYVPNQPQTDTVIFTIKFLNAVLPSGFFLVAILVVMRYPITQAVHLAIRDGIEAHKRGEIVEDPLTQQLLPPLDARSQDEATGWLLDYFSSGELARLLRHGPFRLRRDVWVSFLASFSLLLAAALFGVQSMTGLAVRPGVATVLWIVAAGFSLTAVLFHLTRIKPARELTRSRIESEVIQAHIAGHIQGYSANEGSKEK